MFGSVACGSSSVGSTFVMPLADVHDSRQDAKYQQNYAGYDNSNERAL